MRTDNHASRMMVITLMGLGALASGMCGVSLINEANAIPAVSEQLVSRGGTFTVYEYLNTYTKVGNDDLRVNSIKIDPLFQDISENYLPACTVGMKLPSGSSCNVAAVGDV